MAPAFHALRWMHCCMGPWGPSCRQRVPCPAARARLAAIAVVASRAEKHAAFAEVRHVRLMQLDKCSQRRRPTPTRQAARDHLCNVQWMRAGATGVIGLEECRPVSCCTGTSGAAIQCHHHRVDAHCNHNVSLLLRRLRRLSNLKGGEGAFRTRLLIRKYCAVDSTSRASDL